MGAWGKNGQDSGARERSAAPRSLVLTGPPALLGTPALLSSDHPVHCPAPGSVGSRAFPELLLPPVRVPGHRLSPIFLRRRQGSRVWQGRPHGPLSSPHVPLEAEREGPVLCSPVAAAGPGLAGVPLWACVSAPPSPFPAVFRTTTLGRSAAHRCQPPLHVKSLPFSYLINMFQPP